MPRLVASDPLRNFKFIVQMNGPNVVPGGSTIVMGFTNVTGINMNTDMVPYREGGYNTAFHKLPGQTDFAPLTMVQGVFADRPQMWEMAKKMFSVQLGGGSLGLGGDFRFETTVRVLAHPVTKLGSLQVGTNAAVDSFMNAGDDPTAQIIAATWDQTAVLAFKFYNCWVGSVAFNDLDAGGNQPLISQMTLHHEGFDVLFGQQQVAARG